MLELAGARRSSRGAGPEYAPVGVGPHPVELTLSWDREAQECWAELSHGPNPRRAPFPVLAGRPRWLAASRSQRPPALAEAISSRPLRSARCSRMFHVKPARVASAREASYSDRMFHVKHGSSIGYLSELEASVAQAGLSVDRASLELLLEYLDCILEANERVNLTSVREAEEAVRVHILDSLSVLPEVEHSPDGTLLDLGSGAGFPGVPLGVASGRPTILLESVGRKAQATAGCCERVVHEYPIRVVCARSESYARSNPRSVAVAICRAVAALPTVLELCAPTLSLGGVCIAMAGRLSEEELERGSRTAEILGMRARSFRRLELPGGGEERSIVAYSVVGEPAVNLPRREGMAAKRPLA